MLGCKNLRTVTAQPHATGFGSFQRGLRPLGDETGFQLVFAPLTDHSQGRPGGILSFAPRGLSRVQSAAYIGVSPALFDELVGDGRMPQPKRINSRVVWDRKQLDESFEALPDREDRNPWDEEDAA
jgi:hypothetical protein